VREGETKIGKRGKIAFVRSLPASGKAQLPHVLATGIPIWPYLARSDPAGVVAQLCNDRCVVDLALTADGV